MAICMILQCHEVILGMEIQIVIYLLTSKNTTYLEELFEIPKWS